MDAGKVRAAAETFKAKGQDWKQCMETLIAVEGTQEKDAILEVVKGVYGVSGVSSEFATEIMAADDAMAYMNDRYAVTFSGSTCCLIDKADDGLVQIQAARVMYSNKRMLVKDGNRVKQEGIFDVWLNTTQERFKKLVFEPAWDIPKDPNGKPILWNMWKGWPILPNPEGDCSRYIAHLHDMVCGGNEEDFNFLLDWMAHPIQHPREKEKVGVALVLLGEHGVGKGTLAKVYGKLFGSTYIPIKSLKNLVQDFNFHMKNKLLIFADEVMWGGRKEDANLLKAKITESEMLLQPKGIDITQVADYSRIIFSTNSDWAMTIEPTDRRYFMLEVSSEHIQDDSYFKPIWDDVENKDLLGGLMHLLMTRDISKRNWRRIPETTAKQSNRERSQDLFDSWIRESVRAAETEPWSLWAAGTEEQAVEKNELVGVDPISWTCRPFEKEHEPCHEPNLHMRPSCASGF